MDFLFLLAEGEGSKRPLVRLADRLFEKYPPLIAFALFAAAVVVVAILLEVVLIFIARRIARKTETTVDDAFAAGVPSIIRPLMALIALEIITNVWFRVVTDEDKGDTELTQIGRWVSNALMVVSVLVLTFCVTRVALRMVNAWTAEVPTRQQVGPTIKFAIKAGAVPLGLFLAAEAAGLPGTSILAAASIPAIALGLALQDTLKNMFAGIQLVADQPIRAGDFVDVDKVTRGTVLEIGLRSTKIRSVDNNTIIVPNATIASAVVTNLDFHDRSYIQSLDVSVAYGTDSRRVQAILEDELKRAASEIEGVTPEPNAVALKQLGASSIDFVVMVRMRQWAGRLPIVTELYHRLYARLSAERIEIPFPTRTVLLRQDPASGAAAPSPR